MKTPESTGGYAVKTFLFTLLAAVLCFFLNMSVTLVLSFSTTEKLGVRTSGSLEDGRTLVLEEIYAKGSAPAHRKIFIVDGAGNETVLEDKDVTEAGDTGEELLAQYPVTKSFSQNIRSETDPGLKNATNWVAQILMGILFLAFPYSNMWYLGDRDRNSVQFGHRVADAWRGVKVGLLASIPAVLAWIGLIVCKAAALAPSYVVYYRWMNVCFWPYFNSVIPATVLKTAEVTWGGVAAMLPILFILPLITGIGYHLGYREVSVRDRLVYVTTGKKPKRRKR